MASQRVMFMIVCAVIGAVCAAVAWRDTGTGSMKRGHYAVCGAIGGVVLGLALGGWLFDEPEV